MGMPSLNDLAVDGTLNTTNQMKFTCQNAEKCSSGYLSKQIFSGCMPPNPLARLRAYGTIFLSYIKKFGVKIGSCAITFGPIKNRTFPSDNLSAIKNRSVCADTSPTKNQCDVIQQWDVACHCEPQ